MKLNPPQLDSALKRGLAPVYLVAGEEILQLQEAQDAIRAAARAKGYGERQIFDVERGFDWDALVADCNTGSLFAERRIIDLRFAGAPDAAAAKALVALARRPPPDVLLLVATGKLESRTRTADWFEALDAAGVSLYVWPMKPAEYRPWLEARLRQAGFAADADALRLLAERTEGNLLAAAQTIEKFRLQRPPGRLTVDDIADAVADVAHFAVFGWVDRLLAGDTAGAVRGLDSLRAEGVELPPLIGALTADLRKLAVGGRVYARSRDVGAALRAAQVFKQREAVFGRALTRVRPAQALRWLRDCARIDWLAKAGGQPAVAWEELLVLSLAACQAATSVSGSRGGVVSA